MKVPAGYRLRPLGPTDAATAIAVLDAILPDDWRDGPLPDPAQMARALGHPGALLLIAETNAGLPVGCVSGTVTPGLLARVDVAFLDDLLVAREHRSRGLGRALVSAFRATAIQIAARPVAMWGATNVGNIGCDRAFRATGGVAEADTFREYNWPLTGEDRR